MKKLLLLLCIVLVSKAGIAQLRDCYLPRNYQGAYNNETRSMDGKPGKAYWSNYSDYTIDVRVNPENGLIDGSETIKYYNNSPDTLKRIVIRLYQNIYKKGNTRQFSIGNADLTDGMQIEKLEIDGVAYDPASKDVYQSTTNMSVKLKNPLLPGGVSKVGIDWEFTLPQKRWIRFGQYNEGHLLAGYWYPQIAVYDDIDGWDMIDYVGMVEFYNDINNFNVNIKIASDFVVWATGMLQNPENVFQKKVAGRYQQALTSTEVVKIITQKDYENGTVTKPREMNTWQFRAENVPDFVFAASDNANWDAVSLVVDPKGRRVLTSSVYPEGAAHYEDVAMIARNAVEYMSYELPGWPFPYPQVTVFANGRKTGGMEFPMMANDGAPDDYADLQGLTFHEIFHNYFPFYMGTNERKYAFMDEGWARYFPTGFLKKYAPADEYLQRTISSYEKFAGSENELPPMIPTYIFNDYQTQRMAAYTRPAVAYHFLRETLCEELFKVALLEYMERWNGKHPSPYDFFNTFNEVSSEDLSWFWNPWFFESGYPDLGIKDVTDDNLVLIEKIGNIPVPIELTVTYTDGSEEKITRNARVWKDGAKIVTVQLFADKEVKEVRLGSELVPDSFRENNLWMD